MSLFEDFHEENPEEDMLIDMAFEANEIQKIKKKLDDKKLNDFHQYLKDEHIELICNIMFQFEHKGSITDKQKYCVAKYIYENNLAKNFNF